MSDTALYALGFLIGTLGLACTLVVLVALVVDFIRYELDLRDARRDNPERRNIRRGLAETNRPVRIGRGPCR